MQAIEGNNKSIFSGITSDYNIQVKLYISNLSILENFFNIHSLLMDVNVNNNIILSN